MLKGESKGKEERMKKTKKTKIRRNTYFDVPQCLHQVDINMRACCTNTHTYNIL